MVVVVDVRHLPTPLHVGVRRLLLSLRLPGPPGRRLLLRSADQHHSAFAALPSSGVQQRAHTLFLVLALLEVNDRGSVPLRERLDRFHVRFSDLAERGRRGNRIAFLPAEEAAYLTD